MGSNPVTKAVDNIGNGISNGLNNLAGGVGNVLNIAGALPQLLLKNIKPPKPPKAPAPPKAATPNIAKLADITRLVQQRALAAQGRAGTILTGPGGTFGQAANGIRKTLLGQ